MLCCNEAVHVLLLRSVIFTDVSLGTVSQQLAGGGFYVSAK